ncbi:MAG: hypothetical protein R3F62_19245 [Planctomycetota bacterium]
MECAAAVERRLGAGLRRPARIVLCDTEAGFAARYAELGSGRPPDYALALAFPEHDRILVRTARLQPGTWSDLESTLAHELAHLVLGDVERERGERLPRWLNEGLAEFASGRALLPEERSALAGQARHGTAPSLGDWVRAFPQDGPATARAYTHTCAFLSWVDGQAIDGVPGLVRGLRRGSVDEAFVAELGWTADEAEHAWLEELARDHAWWRTLLFSLNLWGFVTLLALLAFARHAWRTRRLRRELIRQDALEDARRAARLGRGEGEPDHEQGAGADVAEEGLAGLVEVHDHEHQRREGNEEVGQPPQHVLPEGEDQQPDSGHEGQDPTHTHKQ